MNPKRLELLRKINKIIIKSNRIWILNKFYRGIYYLFIRYIIRSFKRFDEIKAIYVDGSISNNTFLPGASDIDLVFIIKDMDSSQEYDFLKEFYKEYFRLKKIFPKLGEVGEAWVEIYSVNEMKLISKYGKNPSFNTDNWKLQYGRDYRIETSQAAAKENIFWDSWMIYKMITWSFFDERNDETRNRNVVTGCLKIKKNFSYDISPDLDKKIKKCINSIYKKKYYDEIKYKLIMDIIADFSRFSKKFKIHPDDNILEKYSRQNPDLRTNNDTFFFSFCYHIIDPNLVLLKSFESNLPALYRRYNKVMLVDKSALKVYIQHFLDESDKNKTNFLSTLKLLTFKIKTIPQFTGKAEKEKINAITKDLRYDGKSKDSPKESYIEIRNFFKNGMTNGKFR